MNPPGNLEVVHWRITAWILTGLSFLWFGFSVPALQQLLALSQGSYFTPMDALCAGLIATHVLFIVMAIRAWLSGKREPMVVESSGTAGHQKSALSIALYLLVFLAFFWLLKSLEVGNVTIWLMFPLLVMELMKIRRQRKWLREQLDSQRTRLL